MTGRQTQYVFPLCDVARLHPQSEAAVATESARQMAKLLRSAWPDANIGPSKRRQLGPPFEENPYQPDRCVPDRQLLQWLASKDLNPIGEGISLAHLRDNREWLYHPVRRVARSLTFKPEAEADADATPTPVHDRRHDQRHEIMSYESDAQMWSFTGPCNWVISLPVLATLLTLMTHPGKQSSPLSDNPNRDLTWTLDSLHGFCRKEGPEEGNRHLSWSLGTFPDQWIFLNFIFYYFTPRGTDANADEWIGSGIRCDRRAITVPLGGPGGEETFRERRVWFSMRTATEYKTGNGSRSAAQLTGPATVGFVLADSFHHRVKMTKDDWLIRLLKPDVDRCQGVKAFQMMLWEGVDQWSSGWHATLDYIDGLYQIQVSDIDNSNPEKLHDLMFDPSGQLAKAYFVAAHLLKIFRQHIDVLPCSLYGMLSRWQRTYPATKSEFCPRFHKDTPLALLANWARLYEYTDARRKSLVDRIEKASVEFLNRRNNLMIARNTICK
ncbi:hypothetical protein F5144DRAFT_609982 [Chaetomium tenue]|uniref:Uncharacterized protein n=1 Tax=Chaetomium tenue TaxID=1854479 RepID=A0ACB7PHP1_9PEZI|nr:hypothetical protein F5144DRAFT_609982 [Chaetomium globosum]